MVFVFFLHVIRGLNPLIFIRAICKCPRRLAAPALSVFAFHSYNSAFICAIRDCSFVPRVCDPLWLGSSFIRGFKVLFLYSLLLFVSSVNVPGDSPVCVIRDSALLSLYFTERSDSIDPAARRPRR